jgi:hypothetical protein
MTRFRFSESGVKPEQIVDGQVEVWFHIDVQERPVLLYPESESEDGSYTVAISRDFLRFQADFYKLTDLEKIGANQCIFHGFIHGEEVVQLEVPITLLEVIRQGEFGSNAVDAKDDFLIERAASTAGLEKLSNIKQAAGVIVHTNSQSRRNILSPLIECAQSKCSNPNDIAQAWTQLRELAMKEVPPLLGVYEERVKYTKDGNAAYLTKAAFGKRMRRKIDSTETNVELRQVAAKGR